MQMEKIKIADACELLNGYAFKSEKYVESGIRIIRIANVQKGFIEDNSPVFYPMDLQEFNKFFLILFHILKTSCIYRLFQAFLFYIYPLLHHFYTIFRLATPSFKLLHFLKQSIFRHMTI